MDEKKDLEPLYFNMKLGYGVPPDIHWDIYEVDVEVVICSNNLLVYLPVT